MKNIDRPDAPVWAVNLDVARSATRCGARRKSDGHPCQGPAIRGRSKCRLHGGKGGGPKGERNGRYRTGKFSQEAVDERRRAKAKLQELRALLAAIKEDENNMRAKMKALE